MYLFVMIYYSFRNSKYVSDLPVCHSKKKKLVLIYDELMIANELEKENYS